MYRADLLLALEKSAIVVACALVLTLLTYMVLIIRVVSVPGRDERIGLAAGATFVFAVIGIVTGITMGASRVAVVANILPAALTFIGGLALWIVSREAKGGLSAPPGQVIVVGVSVVAFTLMLFFGTVLGAFERNRAEFETDKRDYDIARLRYQADVELRINGYRDALGLEPLVFVAPPEE